jgi:3-dehydroquinate synthase
MIFVYGPPASGKSAVGQLLAEGLRLPFFDLDEEIETRAGKTIPQLFAEEGEMGFRQRESEALEEVARRPAGVAALGGGALLRPENRALAEGAGTVLTLSASFETISQRLDASGGSRPLLDEDAQEQLRGLLDQRRGHYNSFPLRMAVDGLKVGEAAWQAQIRLGAFRVEGMGPGYDVRAAAGGLDELGTMLKTRGLRGPLALVSDENVADYHESRALAALGEAGYQTCSIVIPAGEGTKTFATVGRLLDGFLAGSLERGSTVVALGGGVVGDLSGFAAAIYLRGVAWAAVPTSLLAMVDASLGGKTGADLPQGKNLIGAFHPPSLVLADPQLLSTLPTAEMRNGLAEVVKHGVLGDPDLFARCCQGLGALQADPGEIVRRAMAVKVRVIQQDPYELGVRASLNLGHTLGHGLERATDFRLRHGEAVAIGMIAAARIAERMGIAQEGLAGEIEECLDGLGLPRKLPDGIDKGRLIAAIGVDKKRRAGKLRLVLPERIGAVRWGVEIDDPEELVDTLR